MTLPPPPPTDSVNQKTEAASEGASCSGFVVVIRYAGNRYTSVTRPDGDRGIRADEAWIFGEPHTHTEREIWRSVAPGLAWVPDGMVHRIPNAKRIHPHPQEPQ